MFLIVETDFHIVYFSNNSPHKGFPGRFSLPPSSGSFPALKRPQRFALKPATYNHGGHGGSFGGHGPHGGSLNIPLDRPFQVFINNFKKGFLKEKYIF